MRHHVITIIWLAGYLLRLASAVEAQTISLIESRSGSLLVARNPALISSREGPSQIKKKESKPPQSSTPMLRRTKSASSINTISGTKAKETVTQARRDHLGTKADDAERAAAAARHTYHESKAQLKLKNDKFQADINAGMPYTERMEKSKAVMAQASKTVDAQSNRAKEYGNAAKAARTAGRPHREGRNARKASAAAAYGTAGRLELRLGETQEQARFQGDHARQLAKEKGPNKKSNDMMQNVVLNNNRARFYHSRLKMQTQRARDMRDQGGRDTDSSDSGSDDDTRQPALMPAVYAGTTP